jgi:hypothetical protein
MARLTDKELLNTPAAEDLIHVVDVSETTANAAGTSKRSTVAGLATSLTGELDVYSTSETDALLAAKASTSHTHTKSDITDFSEADYATAAQGTKADSAVQSVVAGTNVTVDNTDPLNPIVNASGGGSSHDPVTVTDSAEIDLTLTGQEITAALIAGSIDETKLDTSTNASLNLADSASQPGHTHTKSEITDFNEADYATGAEGDLAATALQPATSSDLGSLGTTEVIDFNGDDYYYCVVNADVTFTHINEAEGRTVTYILRTNGSIQYTATWLDVDEWVSGAEPDMPTTAGRDTVATLLRVGTKTYGFHNTAAGSGSGVSDHGALTGLADDDHTQYTLTSSGAGAPSSTPTRIGSEYLDTTNKRVYKAFGTTSSADWRGQETFENA